VISRIGVVKFHKLLYSYLQCPSNRKQRQPPWKNKDVELRRSVVKQNQVTYINKTTRKNKMSLNKALDDLKDTHMTTTTKNTYKTKFLKLKQHTFRRNSN